MAELRLEELSASTIVAVNNMSLKPGQEEFLSPVSYGVAATVVNPQTSWQRVVLDGDEVVGFVSADSNAGLLFGVVEVVSTTLPPPSVTASIPLDRAVRP